MGGFSYDRDDYYDSSSSGWGSSYSSSKKANSSGYSDFADTIMSARSMSADLKANKTLKASKKLSIIFALDVTGSNTDYAKIVFDKMPMFWGQCEQKVMGGKDDFEICYIGFGDAKTDRAPLQVTDFAQGIDCDGKLSSIYLEQGGGGNNGESSELVGLYALNNIEIPSDTTPILFILTDEPTHGAARKSEAAEVGMTISEDVLDVWTPLKKKFKNNVYCLLGKFQGGYFDQDCLTEWQKLLGKENVIKCGEPKAIVDITLGILNLVMQTMSLDEYQIDMKDRGQTVGRIETVTESLKDLSTALAVINTTTNIATTSTKKTGQRGKRL